MPHEVAAELYDEIVSYLWNDYNALKSCSLTCRAMTIPSQKRLFYSIAIRPLLALVRIEDRISLRNNMASGTSADFKKLLDESPHIAEYVKSLHIIDLRRLYLSERPDNSLLISHSDGIILEQLKWPHDFRWLHRDSSLLSCLPLLRRLEALNIEYDRGLSQAGSTLMQFLQLPSLHFVRILYAHFPIVTLDRVVGANVKHFVTRKCFGLIEEKSFAALSDAPTSPVYLNSLLIDQPTMVGMLFNNPTRRIQMSRLRKLVIFNTPDNDHRATWRILQTCSDTLEEFGFFPSDQVLVPYNSQSNRELLGHTDSDWLTEEPIILSQLPRLRKFTINLWVRVITVVCITECSMQF